ncbi:MAG: multicopper oxidase, type 2 [Rhodospirillales bacterium]|nr:multicopper oxidase, type 2 [Rhodospirillales bacterium]
MRFPFRVIWIASLLLAAPLSARAAWDPHSTPAAPCGVGAPPDGHAPREFVPEGGAKHLSLIVRQDGDRLCYVVDGIAEAPVIRLHPGDQLTVTLRNEITDPAAIETYLPTTSLREDRQPVPFRAGFYPVIPGMHHAATGITNLHLHGFPVPPVPPQDETMKTCADPAVGPRICGGREITYVYEVPATMPTGLYWYHPHIHGEVGAQVQMGLLGAIVIEGPEDEARRNAGIAERVLVIGQTRKPRQKGNAVIGTATTMPRHHPRPARRPATSAHATVDIDHLVGCGAADLDGALTLNGTPIRAGDMEENRLAQGNEVGAMRLDDDGEIEFDHIRKPTPGSDANLPKLSIPAGSKQLWRIVNGATDDYLNLAVVDEEGGPTPIEIIARDGAPLTDDAGRRLPPEPATDRQLLPPGGRLEFLVASPPDGTKRYLVTDAVNTGCAGDPEPARQLAVISAGPAVPPPAVASDESSVKAAPAYFSGLLQRRTDRVRTLALAEYPRAGTADGVDENDFSVTELKSGAEMRPFSMASPPLITVRAGAVEEWVIENWTHELHAFHIHQLHFRVLEENGRPYGTPPLLDVVNVPFATPDATMPPGSPLVPGRVRIKVFFPDELAGDIPFHCHLMQHEDNGMMGLIRVLPTKARASVGWRRAEVLASPVTAAMCHAR